MAIININGDLILDQTAGLQVEDDDVEVTINNAGLLASGLASGLDPDFLTYLNTLALSDTQREFAAMVEGASQADMVTVTPATGETVAKLFFSDASGNDFDGDLVPDVTTLAGGELYLWSAAGGKVVLVTTSSTSVTAGRVVAAFYIEATNTSNTAAKIESITFEALRHGDTNDPDDSVDFSDVLRVSAVVTTGIGDDIVVDDDGPTIEKFKDTVQLTVDETDFDVNDSDSFVDEFTSDYGTDGPGGITYTLGIEAGSTGLVASINNQPVALSVNGDGQVVGTAGGEIVFVVSVDSEGNVTLDQRLAVRHDPDTGPNQSTTLADDNLIKLTATIEDEEGDQDDAVLPIGKNLIFFDDAPSIDPESSATAETPVVIGNAANESGTGAFGYDLGGDSHNAAFYEADGSDFVEMDLTGTVGEGPTASEIDASVTLDREDALEAVFNWTFTFDADPETEGEQPGTAAGTLTFDKDANTFSIKVTDAVEGYSFSVLQTSEFVTKAPLGNNGQPKIVVSELKTYDAAKDDGFYVQFTANTNPNGSPFGFDDDGEGLTPIPNDTTFDAGQLITSNTEDWVSATRSTNGVAGDTIQKGELLTLRFFNENILGDVIPNAPGGGTEKTEPTDSVSGLVLKFDGIGNSEDLIILLDLINVNDSTDRTTKAVFVQNGDFIKGTVPAPYNAEFSLDNNDALVVIEANDYNFGDETYEIQGVQIMQSGNGLNGTAINLNGLVGVVDGKSPPPNQASTQAWETTDQDVLKITDIGFVETTSGVQDAKLDFSFKIADADQDTTDVQHIYAQISNDVV